MNEQNPNKEAQLSVEGLSDERIRELAEAEGSWGACFGFTLDSACAKPYIPTHAYTFARAIEREVRAALSRQEPAAQGWQPTDIVEAIARQWDGCMAPMFDSVGNATDPIDIGATIRADGVPLPASPVLDTSEAGEGAWAREEWKDRSIPDNAWLGGKARAALGVAAGSKPCPHCDAPPGHAHSSSCPAGVKGSDDAQA